MSFNKRWRRKDQSSIKNNKEALAYVCNSVKLSKLYYISTTIYSLVFLIIKNTPIWVWFHTSMQKKRGTRMCIILRIRIRKSLSTAARSFRASFCIEKKGSYEKRLRTLLQSKMKECCTSVSSRSVLPLLLQGDQSDYIVEVIKRKMKPAGSSLQWLQDQTCFQPISTLSDVFNCAQILLIYWVVSCMERSSGGSFIT